MNEQILAALLGGGMAPFIMGQGGDIGGLGGMMLPLLQREKDKKGQDLMHMGLGLMGNSGPALYSPGNPQQMMPMMGMGPMMRRR